MFHFVRTLALAAVMVAGTSAPALAHWEQPGQVYQPAPPATSYGPYWNGWGARRDRDGHWMRTPEGWIWVRGDAWRWRRPWGYGRAWGAYPYRYDRDRY